jgi:hypothetical protein
MTKLLEFAKLSSRLEVVMNELRELLKLIVADLEKSAAAISVLQSGSTDQLTALETWPSKQIGIFTLPFAHRLML